jgi:hypothetical protein
MIPVIGFWSFEGEQHDPQNVRHLGTVYFDGPEPPPAATLVPVPADEAPAVERDLKEGRMPHFDAGQSAFGIPEPGEIIAKPWLLDR